jgi:hypothetical protein
MDSRRVASEIDGAAFSSPRAGRALPPSRDSIDPVLRDNLLKLAEEYTARADAGENDDPAVWQAGSGDRRR